ncbi:hypothetical protein IMSAGC002_02409 [Lachnospiraceae bacterium]|jgi:hypothetical protein|nr:hypothetical protein IMSAGC002_02409 [Lachnospiraceae bacterium]
MIDLDKELMTQKMKVDFNTYDLSVKELLSMVNDGLINIAPDYQRQFRWDDERQSSLIESLFLGIPVPSLFMATNADGTWELIDGVQRVSTMICFAGDDKVREKVNAKHVESLKLKGLSKLVNFNDKRFSDLPIGVQNKFKLTSIKVTTLSDKSDKNVRFDLFERLNRGGITLTPQEIRSCVYRGGFNDFLKELSQDTNFKECVHLSENQENDGTREELVLRFFAYLYDLDSFEHSVKDFLNNYMSKADRNFNYSKNDKLFREVFRILNEALPMGISKGRKNTPLNLFEAVSVGAALAYMDKGKINVSGIEEWLKDKELLKYITGATNSRPRVIGRIEFCRKKFEG